MRTKMVGNMGGTILTIVLMAMLALPVGGMAAEKIRFGILPVVDTLPLHVGIEKGDFRASGIDLELVSFNSALERDAALQAKRLDGYFGDILNTVLLIQSGLEIGIVTSAFHTRPDSPVFAIVGSPLSDIKTMADLKGKTVAISRATIIEYLLDRILEKNGMMPGDVQKLDIKKIPIRLQMLLSGQTPAALLPEPLVTLAIHQQSRIIADDARLDMTLTVLALSRNIVQKDGERVRKFLDGYQKAVQRINQNPESFRETLVTKTKFPAIIKDKYRIPRFPDVTLPSPKDIRDAQQWLIENTMIQNRLPYDEIVWDANKEPHS